MSGKNDPANTPDTCLRRQFLHAFAAATASLPLAAGWRYRTVAAERASGAIDVGSRHELFVDNFLIERLTKA